ncbi:polyribonucleotide nucleotidyltransferase [Patescibacteria group bacterium]|nr:polyribonucleotide nucleotidyltransferase [Patescibacteria group bacterium]MBU1029124.1 polyribonucleotide nucleotidyltransferase [Patescibacteria group bacterium]
MEIRRFETLWGGKTLTIETGKLAHQAGGSCTVRYGDSVILATATMSESAREGIDFFPLSVDYEEKMYAAGKIKGSRFMKREGRPTDEAVMTGRMIDRALRPLFPYEVRHEVQVVIECLSADLENDTDILGMVGASCALAISNIPWEGPIAGIRIGRIGGEWVINPTFEAQTKSDLDVIVAGTPDRVLMLECNAQEVSEEDLNAAIQFGQKHLQEVIKFIGEIVAAIGQPKIDSKKLMGFEEGLEEEQYKTRQEAIAKTREFYMPRVEQSLFASTTGSKTERRDAIRKIKKETAKHLEGLNLNERAVNAALDATDKMTDEVVSLAIVERNQRVDGRSLTDIRPLICEVGLLPRTHGSGLFSRGATQVLSTVTLGGPGDVQILDGMDDNGKKRYFHHYNFPPFSVGETGRLGGGGRREVGHGGLAERALVPVLPEKEAFPYTIRVVSEVFTSNGSSSQASICGSTLALMDAGVPIKQPVAGVAMGLASTEDGRYKILTDLQDLEDGKGGMDFKVAGTRNGITTVQLDTKTKGLSKDIVSETLQQAKDGRLRILDAMTACIASPRPELSPYAPRIETFMIDPERIRDVIGPGGKVINEIIDATGVSIDIENDGQVTVCSANGEAMKRAIDWIRELTREIEVGEMFENGKVVRIMDFGAFVELVPGQDGMVHISELAPWRVNKVTDIVNINDVIPVKVVEIDDMGRVNLSHKQAMKELGREQKMPEGYEIRPPNNHRGGPPPRHGGGSGSPRPPRP